MTGDREAIYQLWLEMTDQAEPEDLSRVWAVRRGEATEPLQIEWYGMKQGTVPSRCGEVVQHPRLHWAACTLDAWDEMLNCPIEAKDCGGREPVEVLIDRYQPQMQWQMECTGANQCALSLILGGNEPVVEYVDRADEYIREMIKRGEQFMRHVTTRTPPVVLDPVPPPADPTKIIDMSSDNRWASEAFVWLNTRISFQQCRDAEKIIKSLVPAEARKAFGHGVCVTRDRAGRKSLREDQQ